MKENETTLDVAGNHAAPRSLRFRLVRPLRLLSIVQVKVILKNIYSKGRWLTMTGVINNHYGKEHAQAERT